MAPLRLLLLLFALGFLLAAVQVGALTIAFDKLGLSPESAMLLLLASLAGSLINMPLFQMTTRPPRPRTLAEMERLLQLPLDHWSDRTVVALNIGGGLVPVLFSGYLIRHNPLPISDVIWAVLAVSALAFAVSRPIPRLGIGMPMFIAPITAALIALLLNPELSAPLAYISGTLGVLIGADLLRLKDIRQLGAPVAAIGGAGTFDGIFLTGVVAVLLA